METEDFPDLSLSNSLNMQISDSGSQELSDPVFNSIDTGNLELVPRKAAYEDTENAILLCGNIKYKSPTGNISTEEKYEVLTTKNAVELLLDGTLRKKVCRYCLNVVSPLSELDQVLQIAGKNTLYKVTIKDMVASFHPFKVAHDPNFPNKICEKCLDLTISSYLFTQQCERSERALRNCFEDMYEKLEKLDCLDQPKKRGRQKLNPNYNTLYTEHKNVLDYAEPIINIINSGSELQTEPNQNKFECLKCWRVLPTLESLLNHEKIHPKSMWCHCRECGKSFPRRNLLLKHVQTAHVLGKQLQLSGTDFKCTQCGYTSTDYHQHLRHIEKHKFQAVMEHLLERDMDKLCAVCFNKDPKLEDMNKIICLHGGFPEMMGDKNIVNILGSTVPEMNILHNYTGSKICEKCLNHAIISYVFIHQTQYVRKRINTCITQMLEYLDKIQNPENNVFVEVSNELILPSKEEEFDDNLYIENEEDVDEDKLKVDVLEDEFRIESESEESTDSDDKRFDIEEYFVKFNPNKNARYYTNKKLLNGVKNDVSVSREVCKEFLTFKKRVDEGSKVRKCRYTCPICNKRFISDYFFKRHVLRHVVRKSECSMCGLEFQSKFSLHEHKRACHILKLTNYLSCNVCGRTFATQRKLDQHEVSHRTKQCELCDKSFISQKYYDSHMQRHSVKLRAIKAKEVQTCSFCEKECINDVALTVHVNRIHLQIKPYTCDMCDKQFYAERNLASHKKMHSMVSKEACTFCGKTLKCRRDLVIHVRKHIGVRPHACQICDQSFYSQFEVRKHLRVFHGGRFCCKICKTVYSTCDSLKLHIKIVHNSI